MPCAPAPSTPRRWATASPPPRTRRKRGATSSPGRPNRQAWAGPRRSPTSSSTSRLTVSLHDRAGGDHRRGHGALTGRFERGERGQAPGRGARRVVFETESTLSGPIRVVDQGDERRLVAGGHTLSAISLSGDWSRLKGEYWCRALDMVELPRRPFGALRRAGRWHPAPAALRPSPSTLHDGSGARPRDPPGRPALLRSGAPGAHRDLVWRHRARAPSLSSRPAAGSTSSWRTPPMRTPAAARSPSPCASAGSSARAGSSF